MFHGGKERRLSRIAYPMNQHFDPEHTTLERFSKELHLVEEPQEYRITGIKLPPFLCGIIRVIG